MRGSSSVETVSWRMSPEYACDVQHTPTGWWTGCFEGSQGFCRQFIVCNWSHSLSKFRNIVINVQKRTDSTKSHVAFVMRTARGNMNTCTTASSKIGTADDNKSRKRSHDHGCRHQMPQDSRCHRSSRLLTLRCGTRPALSSAWYAASRCDRRSGPLSP